MGDWRRHYNEDRPYAVRSGTTSRSHCIITVTLPAHHREEAGKLQPPAIQGWVSVQSTEGFRAILQETWVSGYVVSMEVASKPNHTQPGSGKHFGIARTRTRLD
ncbi:hypothetical protein IWQ48_004203 [Labrenzia sp. EL_13]|nr:hypothetical protein [Labrenzia sp. EL_13]